MNGNGKTIIDTMATTSTEIMAGIKKAGN